MSSAILLSHACSVRAGQTYHPDNSTYLLDNPLDTQPAPEANTRGPDHHVRRLHVELASSLSPSS